MATATSDEKHRLHAVWNQKAIPVILRRTNKSLCIRLPFEKGNRDWLKGGGRNHHPEWNKAGKHWELPRSRFNELIERALEKYGKVYIIQPFQQQEKCAPACMNAAGHECQCSCMGANHGAGNDGTWLEISETFATRWGEQNVACRLMTAKPPAQFTCL